jgi:DNA modification methylase
MQTAEIIEKRKREAEKKKLKPSVYDSLMFQQIEKPAMNKESIFSLKDAQPVLDQIILQDSRNMHQVSSNSVTLIITSPPYNVNKSYTGYKDQSGLDEYLNYLDDTWKECFRILRPGGRLCINIANIGRSPYLPLESYFIQRLLKIGFFMRGQIIWDKDSSVGVSTAWGSWLSPTNPTLRDVHEYILIFSKQTNTLKKSEESADPDITKEEFLEFTKSHWKFPTENAKKIGHPAPFPVELPYRCIKLFSFPGDLVLDPFVGSGTTCLAAKKTQRHYLGFDIDPSYVELSNTRLQKLV